MASVRIAGIVGDRDAHSIKNVASLMQVARWVRLMNEDAPVDALPASL